MKKRNKSIIKNCMNLSISFIPLKWHYKKTSKGICKVFTKIKLLSVFTQ